MKNEEIHEHYLEKQIQSEQIAVIWDKVLQTIFEKIKFAKYFAIILFCTPDVVTH